MSSAAEIDPALATALGFLKSDYAAIERERRWLCRDFPRELILETWSIADLYVQGTQLRLREARRLDGGPARLRFTRKADVDPRTRLITTIYLTEGEFAVLSGALSGLRLGKLRHRLRLANGSRLSVDEFQGDLAGLLLAEKEFETDAALAAYAPPDFLLREVTEDPRYGGASLAAHGLPAESAA